MNNKYADAEKKKTAAWHAAELARARRQYADALKLYDAAEHELSNYWAGECLDELGNWKEATTRWATARNTIRRNAHYRNMAAYRMAETLLFRDDTEGVEALKFAYKRGDATWKAKAMELAKSYSIDLEAK